ncbi:MAG: EthD domain-containing protein [Myxococcota bacterium]
MIKTLSLIKRLPSLDRAAFREHYETAHAPLALPHLAGLMRYVRYHVEEVLVGDVSFDVISAFWYRDARATEAIFEMLESEAGKAILLDEQKFMDKAANRFFPVSERPWVEGDEGEEHLFVFLARPEGTPRYDYSRMATDEHWPSLVEALGGVSFALLRDTFPMEGAPELWDAVMQVRAEDLGGLQGFVDQRRKEGDTVAAVRTRRFETVLPEGGIPSN